MTRMLVLFVSSFFISNILFAQSPYATSNTALTQQLQKNELCVVYLGNAQYDSTLKKAVLTYWKANNKISFVTKPQAEDMISDENKSFMFTKTVSWSMNNSASNIRQKAGIILINGGKKKYKKYDFRADAAATISFDYYGYEYHLENVSYRISLAIEALSNVLQGKPEAFSKVKALKEKILLISENIVDRGSKGRAKVISEASLASYKYKYEIVSDAKIKELIDARDSRYALFVPVLSDNNHHIEIYDVGGKGIIHFYGLKGTVMRWPYIKEAEWIQLSADINSSK